MYNPQADAISIITAATQSLSRNCGAVGRAGANLAQAIGSVQSNAATYLAQAAIGTPLKACFDAAIATVSDVYAARRVRTDIEALLPASALGVIVQILCWRNALLLECQALAQTTFTSRQQIDAHIAVLNTAFDWAEVFAADANQTALYQSFIAMRGAVMRDLTQRARPLPRMVSMTMTHRYSSLLLAYKLYGDPSRADELRAENDAVHPGFMPTQLVALSD